MSAELIRAARPERQWWHDLTELAAFGRWLTDTGRGPTDPWDVVEKPWHWSSEHETFVREEAHDRLAAEAEAAEDEEWRDMQRRAAL